MVNTKKNIMFLGLIFVMVNIFVIMYLKNITIGTKDMEGFLLLSDIMSLNIIGIVFYYRSILKKISIPNKKTYWIYVSLSIPVLNILTVIVLAIILFFGMIYMMSDTLMNFKF